MTENDRLKIKALCEAVLCLQSREECSRFFGDILSTVELTYIARRFWIAVLLYEGATYREIIEKTGSANITISRVKGVLETDHSTLLEIVRRMDEGCPQIFPSRIENQLTVKNENRMMGCEHQKS